MGAFWFLKLEIQSLNSVVASSEADSYWAGCSPAPAQKKFLSPKMVIITLAATTVTTVITISATMCLLYTRHFSKGFLYSCYLNSNYFLTSYYAPGSVLATCRPGGIHRKNMIPGDLTLQEGEAREHTSKLTREKKIIFIEKKAP